MRNFTYFRRWRRAARQAALITTVIILGTGCANVSIGPGAGEDCLPAGPALCGPPWDRDDDTISTNTEENSTNKTAFGGFYNFDVTKWDLNQSQARGDPSGSTGALFMGMNLKDFGTGYIHHNGEHDPVDSDDWGTGHMLRLLEAVGRDWGNFPPRMQPGDISLKAGGQFCSGPAGQQVCHSLHRRGLDVDVRYVRNDNLEIPLNICDDPPEPNNKYHLVLTLELLEAFLRAGNGEDGAPKIVTIFIDKTASGLDHPLFVDAAGHCNHFHVRIEDPDGIN